MVAETATHQRAPVWIALSDLCLDTELDERALDHIANVVRASGLSAPEVDGIFNYELAPFLANNLLAPAGEWSGFDPAWVCAEATKRMGHRPTITKLGATLGITTKGARETFEQVKERAFRAA